jgi:hypothetical protein
VPAEGVHLTVWQSRRIMKKSPEKPFTPFPEIDEVLIDIAQRIKDTLGDNLAGIYLFGSLTYGDFNLGRSDIDLMTLVNRPLTTDEVKKVLVLHRQVETVYPQWLHRIENSFTPTSMLGNTQPPLQPRPYYNDGEIWDAQYGNEWIINLYLLDKHGITLAGQDIHELVKSIDIKDVQEACKRDLLQEWEPKLRDPEWLDNSHYQSYLVLNLCRILYTIQNSDARSKKVSAQWVKSTYPQWQDLIDTASSWHYGMDMRKQAEALEFLKFVIGKTDTQESSLSS